MDRLNSRQKPVALLGAINKREPVLVQAGSNTKSMPSALENERPLFHGIELVHTHITQGTDPIFRQIFKGCAWGNATIRVPLGRIIHIPAIDADVFHVASLQFQVFSFKF